jgi:iron complex outermembrane receptor protein
MNGTAQMAVLTNNPSTGKEPVGVPAHIFNLWTSYDFRIAGIRGFRISGGLNYRDKIYRDTLNTKVAPAFTKEDVAVSYTPRECGLSLGVRNLTDTTYFAAANGAGVFVGEPRSFLVQLKGTFGKK